MNKNKETVEIIKVMTFYNSDTLWWHYNSIKVLWYYDSVDIVIIIVTHTKIYIYIFALLEYIYQIKKNIILRCQTNVSLGNDWLSTMIMTKL